MQSTSADVRGPLKVEVLTQQGWRGRIGAAAAVRPGGGGWGWELPSTGRKTACPLCSPSKRKPR